MQARKRASEKSTLAFKTRADITRSPKQGYQWPQEKDLCPPIFFLKKIWLENDIDSAVISKNVELQESILH